MKKDVKNKILFTAQDPGGFNALCPVIKKIMKGCMDVKVCLANESRDIAKRNKINYLDCTNISDRKLEKLINEFRPDIAVVATSDGLSVEKKITAWAKSKNIKTISIIDFWSNYKMRFSNPGTHDLAYMPNAICIIDKYMKKEMLEQGFEESQLYITGNPFFDLFKTRRSAQAKYILFASQPFSEIEYETNKAVNSPFFNEVDIFADYVKILKGLKVKQPIFIALHPRCKKRDKYNKIIAKSELNISVAKDGTEDLINGAELVIGINTMVLFQAAMIG
ncbi:MAG: hypothetical protein Q8P40_13305, partial [Nitrospirota bacterium]|nr:hypothetical protein [Nitrospirota bacterium]